MSDEGLRIYPPTPQQLARLRTQGVFSHSREIVSLGVLSATLVALSWVGGALFLGATASMVDASLSLKEAPQLVTLDSIGALLLRFAMPLALPLVVIMVMGIFGALISNIAQIGFIFVPTRIMPKLSNLDPIKGMGRVFGKQAKAELMKNLAKVGIVGTVLTTTLLGHQQDIVTFAYIDLRSAVGLMASVGFEIAWKVVAAFILVAFVDYLGQRKQFEKRAKMGRSEYVRDLRDLEGDSRMKQVRSEMYRNILSARSELDVKNATGVVVNPTHVAVAIAFDPSVQEEPWVVAKGEGLAAARIRRRAKEAGVPIISQPPLARALNRYVKVGDPIPALVIPELGELWPLVVVLLNEIYALHPEREPEMVRSMRLARERAVREGTVN